MSIRDWDRLERYVCVYVSQLFVNPKGYQQAQVVCRARQAAFEALAIAFYSASLLIIAERRNPFPYFLAAVGTYFLMRYFFHQVAERALEKKRHHTLTFSNKSQNLKLALHDFHYDSNGLEKFIQALSEPRAKALNRTVPISPDPRFRKSVLWVNLGGDHMRLYQEGVDPVQVTMWNGRREKKLPDQWIYDKFRELGLCYSVRDLMYREIGYPSRMTRDGMIRAIRCKLRNPDFQGA